MQMNMKFSGGVRCHTHVWQRPARWSRCDPDHLDESGLHGMNRFPCPFPTVDRPRPTFRVKDEIGLLDLLVRAPTAGKRVTSHGSPCRSFSSGYIGRRLTR